MSTFSSILRLFFSVGGVDLTGGGAAVMGSWGGFGFETTLGGWIGMGRNGRKEGREG